MLEAVAQSQQVLGAAKGAAASRMRAIWRGWAGAGARARGLVRKPVYVRYRIEIARTHKDFKILFWE